MFNFKRGSIVDYSPMTSSTTTAKLRMVCSQQQENDVGMAHMILIIQEKYKVSLFLCIFSNLENGLLPNKIILISNNEKA